MKYYLMNEEHASPLLARHPKAARCDNGLIVFTGDMPKDFDGEIVDISVMEITDEQMVVKINRLRVEIHTGKLVILSRAQGKYLGVNHSSFKQPVSKEI